MTNISNISFTPRKLRLKNLVETLNVESNEFQEFPYQRNLSLHSTIPEIQRLYLISRGNSFLSLKNPARPKYPVFLGNARAHSRFHCQNNTQLHFAPLHPLHFIRTGNNRVNFPARSRKKFIASASSDPDAVGLRVEARRSSLNSTESRQRVTFNLAPCSPGTSFGSFSPSSLSATPGWARSFIGTKGEEEGKKDGKKKTTVVRDTKPRGRLDCRGLATS